MRANEKTRKTKWGLNLLCLLTAFTMAAPGPANAVVCLIAGGPVGCLIPAVVAGGAALIEANRKTSLAVNGFSDAEILEQAKKFRDDFPEYTGLHSALFSRAGSNQWMIFRRDVEDYSLRGEAGLARMKSFHRDEVAVLSNFLSWLEESNPKSQVERFAMMKSEFEKFSALASQADAIYGASFLLD